MRRTLFLSALVAVLGCAPSEGETPDFPGQCDDWSAESGDTPCVHAIDSQSVYAALAQRETVKYFLPERPDSALTAPTFINTQLYQLHICFISTFFGDGSECESIAPQGLFDGPGREYSVGYIEEYETGRWGFDVRVSSLQDAEREVRSAFDRLQPRFSLGRLDYRPESDALADAALSWRDLPFEVVPNDQGYVGYSRGRGCGRVRILNGAELEEAEANGVVSFRDVLVLERAPLDLAPVVSAIATATRQGPLSHLSVRSAARGTPNMFAADALARFLPHADTLVCIDVGEDGYEITPASAEEVEEFWNRIRPPRTDVIPPNRSDASIVSLRALPTATPEARQEALARYGAKGTNLAILYQLTDRFTSFNGVLLPGALHERFMREQGWEVDLGDGPARHSFRETVDAWFADDALLRRPSELRMRLSALQEAMESAPVPEDIVASVHAAITEEFGTDLREVRFRSSSNAEDALGFSGAGLYDSTTVCARDSVDDDSEGPSACNRERGRERTIERGLRRVWASLWNVRAVLERDWYRIDAFDVSMSILVNDRTPDERANLVAFSGNPIDGSDDLLLNAQVGDVDLVRPEPGVRPESILLIRSGDRIDAVQRLALSTEVDRHVVSDEDARRIGELLIQLETTFPFDGSLQPGHRLMLDTEWKVLNDGSLVIKQLRPFVREYPGG